jgi:small-conductance mechanosensitive channel
MEYPASIEVRTPDELARWRPFVQWILAIPHVLIAGALSYVAGALAIISWFVILFTGKLPDGIANLQVMIIRYTARAYAYAGYLHDEYPPFDFTMTASEPGGTPVDVALEPALNDRNRLTVGLRFIWIIPAALFAFVISFVGMFVWIVAAFAILFTRRWPTGLLDWAGKYLRVWLRLEVYGWLLTDEYPPFSTD